MSLPPTILAGSRRLIACLILAVMVLRGLVPVGMMPDLSRLADGAIPLVICTGAGERTILVDLDTMSMHPEAAKAGQTDHQGSDDAQPGLCPFALAFGWALPVLLLALALLLVWPPSGALRPPLTVLPKQGGRDDNRLARGPPVAAA